MRPLILIIFILFKANLFSQDLNLIENKLNDLIKKRNFWHTSDDKNAYDSLARYNKEFEKLILNFTSKKPKTLTHHFNKVETDLTINTSKDGHFRIYTWDTLEGGTMHFYKNVFQYSIDGKVYSKLNEINEEDNSCSFYEINEVEVKNKHYYVTNSISVGSSAVYYFEAKIFSIENGKLNENAKLIKTKSGIKNTLGYEIDLSSSSNRDRTDGIQGRDYMNLIYDKKSKSIIIPLINANGKITKKKIVYKFKGEYFEKI